MNAHADQRSARLARGTCRRAVVAGLLLAVWLGGSSAQAQTNTGTVLGWNNLGMHCMDSDFSVFCILPPYNVVLAQAIDASGALVGGANGVTVTYAAVADPSGSINTTSAGKANFWDHALALFGIAPAMDVGLPVPGPNSYAMPGVNNVAQGMEFDTTYNWFAAYGIPITPIDDAGRTNRYPMMRLTAKSGSTTLDATDIVLPISTEMDCRACHGSGTGLAAQPANGWVNLPDKDRDYRLNILRIHDDRQLGTPVFATALLNAGYSPAGLYANVVVAGKPILCASCHRSEALPGSGQTGIPPLTESVHTLHGGVSDPTNGMLLDSEANRTSCYYCHPGQATRCLRGVMGSSVAADGSLAMECQGCHGSMNQVGAATRTGWLNEPNCQACHTGDAVSNDGQMRYTSVFSSPTVMRVAANQTFATTPNAPAAGYSLYRYSTGHGGLYCEACHGSTHAEFPSIDVNDNVTCIQHQGHIGPMAECDACHGTQPNTVNGGPHGLHPLGQTWVSRHQDNHGSQCMVCHGTDYHGTVLSRARGDRTLSANGTKTFWRGAQIGCYTCHNGPGGSGTPPPAAVVTSRTATTAADMQVAIPLQATGPSGSTLTLRVVSPAVHGRVGLVGMTATYYPDPGFGGSDSFTFAAWDGNSDSNLGTVTITVTGGSSGGGGGGNSNVCTYAIAPANAAVGAAAGSASITVTTGAGCAWKAAANVSWLTITSGASGTGPGSVTYAFAANATTANRVGTLTVAGLPFTVTQAGTTCTYAITPASASVGAAAAGGSVTVTTGANCLWTASANSAWLAVTAGASGTGPGTVAYTIAANTSTTGRSGTLTVAGLTFTVTQAGAAPNACSYAIAPASVTVGTGSTNGVVTVTTTPSCRWSASSGDAWLTITSGTNGMGNGTVRYSVAPNRTTVTRNGMLTIAGKTFVVTQTGNAVCTYVITPTTVSFSSSPASSSFRITTGGSCRWTARSTNSWVTITSSASGMGNGLVQFQLSRNQSTRPRVGTITLADRTFTIYQAGAPREASSTFGNVSVASAGDRERLTLELIVRNPGPTAVGRMQPAVYLSDDPKRDAGDTLLWTRPVAPLEPGEDTVEKVRLTLPAGVSARGKYLVAAADIHLPLAGTPPLAVYGPLR